MSNGARAASGTRTSTAGRDRRRAKLQPQPGRIHSADQPCARGSGRALGGRGAAGSWAERHLPRCVRCDSGQRLGARSGRARHDRGRAARRRGIRGCHQGPRRVPLRPAHRSSDPQPSRFREGRLRRPSEDLAPRREGSAGTAFTLNLCGQYLGIRGSRSGRGAGDRVDHSPAFRAPAAGGDCGCAGRELERLSACGQAPRGDAP
jgi:hypothetical protein